MANPNPSPSTRFGAENGNPSHLGGKTKAQRELEYEAAEKAAKIRHKMISVMLEMIENGADPLELMDAQSLKLFKDSEDRAHGTPKQTSEIAGPGGGNIPMSLKVITEIVDGD